jgi:hypothetical protein
LAEYSPEWVKWAYGEPDMVVDVPPQTIPATGVQDYRNIMVPLELEEDVWVKAVEFEAWRSYSSSPHHRICLWSKMA